MVNAQLLDEKISKSGYKVNYICDTLGMTRSCFSLKKNNKRSFRVSEIFVLSHLLNISEEEKQNIFFAQQVNQ